MSNHRQTQDTNLDRLIAADPIERLLAAMQAEILVRTRRLADPKVSIELQVLKSCAAELEEALNDARNGDVIGNVKDAAKLSNRGVSTVRRLCDKYKEKAGASFVEGEWSIHLPTFMRFQATLRRRPAKIIGDDERETASTTQSSAKKESNRSIEEAA